MPMPQFALPETRFDTTPNAKSPHRYDLEQVGLNKSLLHLVLDRQNDLEPKVRRECRDLLNQRGRLFTAQELQTLNSITYSAEFDQVLDNPQNYPHERVIQARHFVENYFYREGLLTRLEVTEKAAQQGHHLQPWEPVMLRVASPQPSMFGPPEMSRKARHLDGTVKYSAFCRNCGFKFGDRQKHFPDCV